jgi:hypothetical protein
VFSIVTPTRKGSRIFNSSRIVGKATDGYIAVYADIADQRKKKMKATTGAFPRLIRQEPNPWSAQPMSIAQPT